MALVKNKDK